MASIKKAVSPQNQTFLKFSYSGLLFLLGGVWGRGDGSLLQWLLSISIVFIEPDVLSVVVMLWIWFLWIGVFILVLERSCAKDANPVNVAKAINIIVFFIKLYFKLCLWFMWKVRASLLHGGNQYYMVWILRSWNSSINCNTNIPQRSNPMIGIVKKSYRLMLYNCL